MSSSPWGKKMKLGSVSFYTSSEPHVHREDTPNFWLIPLALWASWGTGISPGLPRWNRVWFSDWRGNWLFFAELCEIRHLVSWHRGGGGGFSLERPQTFCANAPRGTTSRWKGRVAICKLLSRPNRHPPTLISCGCNKRHLPERLCWFKKKKKSFIWTCLNYLSVVFCIKKCNLKKQKREQRHTVLAHPNQTFIC